MGLQAVLSEAFPIESYDGQIALDFVSYEIKTPKLSMLESLREGGNLFCASVCYVQIREGEDLREDTLFMGEIPLMTKSGSFVINGAERVIVSQLHRSPGICFEQSQHANGSILHSFRIIPDHGSWIEAQFDTSDLIYIYLIVSVGVNFWHQLLRALGYATDEEILSLYYTFETFSLAKRVFKEEELKIWY